MSLGFLWWWYQFIEWLKFETRPSSLRNSGMANYTVYKGDW